MINTFKKRLKQFGKKLSGKLFAKVLAGLFVCYLLVAYFAVNPIAKKLVPSIAESALASKASVGSVKFDPFRFKVTIKDFALANQGGAPLASFKKLIVDLELSGMFDLAWKFKQVSISEPQGHLTVASNGQFNWDGLLAKLNENPALPSDTIPRLIIDEITVNHGKVQYRDENRPTPIHTTLAPLSFALKGFSTLPKDRGDYLISAVFAENGGSLKWKGDMGVNPVASKGVVALDGVNIAQALQLVQGLTLPFTLSSGKAHTSFAYDFSLPKAVPTLALNNMTVSLREVVGELTQGGSVSLNHAVISAPQLTFVKNITPVLRVSGLDFKLLGLNLTQSDAMQLALKESTASLPQLDFVMQETPQLSFADLSLQFIDFDFNQGNQFSLAVPVADVSNVSLNLAESHIGIKEISLSEIRFDKGNAGAELEKQQKADKPLAKLDQITITDGRVALEDRKISAQSVLLSGLETSVIRSADASLNWMEVFEPKHDDSAPEIVEDTSNDAGKDQPSTWGLALAKVALSDASIHVRDDGAPTPVKLDIEKANIEVENVSLDMTKPLPVKAAFSVKQGGRFSTKGQLWPAPFKAELGLRLSKLSLKPFAPYVNQFAVLKLSSGAADVSGKLRLKQKKDFSLAFNGKFNVKQLALLEEADNAPFLSWDSLASDSLKLSLMPNKLHVATLNIVKPSGKFIINEDKSTNINRILRNSTQGAITLATEAMNEAAVAPVVSGNSLIQAKAPQPSKSVVPQVKSAVVSESVVETFPVSIDSIRVDNAKLAFADLSLTPQFGTNIHSLGGVINGLSTAAGKVSQVEMDGKVDAYGSARIRGTLQPFNATDFTDVKLAFTNLDMSQLTPYSGKFAGRHIDSGKLSVDLEYKIKQQQLIGENKFIINKLKLGKRVESSDAADLPLDLAIAILEDSDGVIDLDLPISGSLDDPQFSYSSIFWKAFRNVLTKIVTAPFRALGKIFGGGGEDFDGIAFEAGESGIAPPELEKLVKVSQALAKRQGLSLGIVPSYNNQLDTQAIKEASYRQQVAEEMGLKLEVRQRPGPVDLTNEDVQDAINALHDTLTKKGLFKRMVAKFEKPEDGHFEKAQTSLIASIEVTEADLEKLAEARGKAILAVLLDNGISENRLATMGVVAADAKGESVKTALTLDVKQSAAETNTPNTESDNEPSTEASNPV